MNPEYEPTGAASVDPKTKVYGGALNLKGADLHTILVETNVLPEAGGENRSHLHAAVELGIERGLATADQRNELHSAYGAYLADNLFA